MEFSLKCSTYDPRQSQDQCLFCYKQQTLTKVGGESRFLYKMKIHVILLDETLFRGQSIS